MSELPEDRAGTPTEGAKEHAWASVNEARASWSGAMRAHEQAPPDLEFRDRLRALAEAAAAMRDAHARALDAGLAWRPVADSERARPPYELRPGTGRRGPAELWTRFDAAVQRLNQAGAGDNLGDVVDGYAAVARPPRSWPTRCRARGSNATYATSFEWPSFSWGRLTGSPWTKVGRSANAGWRARLRESIRECSFACPAAWHEKPQWRPGDGERRPGDATPGPLRLRARLRAP